MRQTSGSRQADACAAEEELKRHLAVALDIVDDIGLPPEMAGARLQEVIDLVETCVAYAGRDVGKSRQHCN